MTDNLKQGEGGATRSRRSGSPRDQGEGGARSKGPSIPQKGGMIPANVPPGRKGGSHLQPHPARTNKTAERGGGTIFGHDRVNPSAGKSKSGDHMSQHPSLQGRKAQRVVNPYK